jgi:DNA-binding NarL/FixJ family response regulator
MAKLRVLVADDSQFQRVAYKRVLETQDHLEVVGMAADGEEAVRLAEQLSPDVVILDIRMPKVNGIEAAQRITSARPGTGIVVISHYDDTEYILELLKDGPDGKAYLLKTSVDDIDDLIRAVGAVAEGQTVLDPVIVQRLARVHSLQSGSPLAQLTEREREVLSLMAEGYNNAVIAQRLVVEERTVENHTNSIYAKLNLTQAEGYHRRVQAVLAFVTQSSPTTVR